MIALLAGVYAVAIEEPNYAVVKTYPEFEVRRYEPFLVAETEVTGDFDEVGNQAFRIFAAYLFGESQSRAKMDAEAGPKPRLARVACGLEIYDQPFPSRIVTHCPEVPIEEHRLRARFPAYRAYVVRTPHFLPFQRGSRPCPPAV